MRRLLLLVACALTLVGVTGTADARDGSDSSGTHSYTSTCEAGLPRFTNTSDPTSTGNGVIEFRAAGATLTLGPGDSGVLDPGEERSEVRINGIRMRLPTVTVDQIARLRPRGGPLTATELCPKVSADRALSIAKQLARIGLLTTHPVP